MEQAELDDNFIREMEDFLQGHHHFTIYCPPTRAHTRFFNRATWRSILILGLLASISFELAIIFCEIISENDAGASADSVYSLVARAVGGAFQREESVAIKYAREGQAGYIVEMGSGWTKVGEILNVREGQDRGSTKDESETITGISSKVAILSIERAWEFLFRTFFLMMWVASFQLITCLACVFGNVLERFLTSVCGKQLLMGLFRIKRVTRYQLSEPGSSEGRREGYYF